jgi:hypothetical protein
MAAAPSQSTGNGTQTSQPSSTPVVKVEGTDALAASSRPVVDRVAFWSRLKGFFDLWKVCIAMGQTYDNTFFCLDITTTNDNDNCMLCRREVRHGQVVKSKTQVQPSTQLILLMLSYSHMDPKMKKW